ncbi:MAG TPA: DUF5683 domain-containing protein [Bacteroidia bacterium]|nr:DUF5683 domain-containing protein [Bacteroidia bacterium]
MLNSLFSFTGYRKYTNRYRYWLAVTVLLCMFHHSTTAQTVPAPDSLSLLHSPKKASIYSAVLPGLGQAYNKKYWKIPLIYAGFAGMGYFIVTNNDKYKTYRTAYLNRVDDDPNTTDPYTEIYSDQDLITLKDYYRRNRDLAIICSGLWYVINILDASVDAHLFYFDVGDNLSLQLTPGLQYAEGVNAGLSLSLHF